MKKYFDKNKEEQDHKKQNNDHADDDHDDSDNKDKSPIDIFDSHIFQKTIGHCFNQVVCISSPLIYMIYCYIILNYSSSNNQFARALYSNLLREPQSLHKDDLERLKIDTVANGILSHISEHCFIHNISNVKEQELTDEIDCAAMIKMFAFIDETSDNPAHYLLDEEHQKHRFIDLIFMDVISNSSEHFASINNNMQYLGLDTNNQIVKKVVNQSSIVSLLYLRVLFQKTLKVESRGNSKVPIINDVIECRYSSNEYMDVVILDTVGNKFEIILVSVKKGMEEVVREIDIALEITKMQITNREFLQLEFPLINKNIMINVGMITKKIYDINLDKEIYDINVDKNKSHCNIVQLITLEMDANGINVSEKHKRKRTNKEQQSHKITKLKKEHIFTNKSSGNISNITNNKKICFNRDLYMFLSKFRNDHTLPIQPIVSVYIPTDRNPLSSCYSKQHLLHNKFAWYTPINETLPIFAKRSVDSLSILNVTIHLSIFNQIDFDKLEISRLKHILSSHRNLKIDINISCTKSVVKDNVMSSLINLINKNQVNYVYIGFSNNNTEIEQLCYLLLYIKCSKLILLNQTLENTVDNIKKCNSLRAFVDNNKELIKLGIANRAVEGQRILVDSIVRLSWLQKLYFNNMVIDLKYLGSFAQFCSNLKSLTLTEVNIEGDAFTCLSRFVNLNYLNLSNIFHNTMLDLSLDYFSFVKDLKHLVTLNLSYLMSNHPLTLRLDNDEEKYNLLVYFTDNLFRNLKASCSITKLSLCGNRELFLYRQNSIALLDFVAEYTKLKKLRLDNTSYIRSDCLASIIQISNVAKLYVGDFGDTSKVVKAILNNRFLVKLNYSQFSTIVSYEDWYMISYVLSINYLHSKRDGIAIKYYGLLADPIATIIMTLLACVRIKQRQWKMAVPKVLTNFIIKTLDYHSWIDMVSNDYKCNELLKQSNPQLMIRNVVNAKD